MEKYFHIKDGGVKEGMREKIERLPLKAILKN